MSDSTARTDSTKTTLVFISSFAAGAEGAIGAFHLDLVAGTLRRPIARAGLNILFSPSPDRRFLYSIQRAQFGGTEMNTWPHMPFPVRRAHVENRQRLAVPLPAIWMWTPRKTLLVYNY